MSCSRRVSLSVVKQHHPHPGRKTPALVWGGVLLVDDAATVATLAGAVVSANMGLVWGCVVAEGIAGHAEVERGAASVELPLRQSWG